jgi:hypothetical protein
MESGAMLPLRCKRGETGLYLFVRLPERVLVIHPREQSRASDSVIHPHFPTGKALSDADNASSSTALSLRASGGVDVPRPMAALIVFHIPMTEPLYCL